MNEQLLVDLLCYNNSQIHEELTISTTLCPGTNFLTPHSWECPYVEDPYWICRICGQQSGHPFGTIPIQMNGQSTKCNVQATSSPRIKTRPSNFRIRATVPVRDRKVPRRIITDHVRKSVSRSKVLRAEALSRSRSRTCITTTNSTVIIQTKSEEVVGNKADRAGRKYISKKKQQFLALLRNMEEQSILKPLESILLVDLEKILLEYLQIPLPEHSKRKPLDSSYLLYQLLRHHSIALETCEKLISKDKPSRAEHDTLYSKLAHSAGLTFYPVVKQNE